MYIYKYLILFLLFFHTAYAQDHEHKAIQELQTNITTIGIDEKLGQMIPMDTMFTTSNNEKKSLREIVTVPTLIAPVYYTCPSVCNLLQSSLASILPRVTLEPGKDFQVISLSFDENDTPAIAARKKKNYMAALNGKFPKKDWIFLTGTQASIKSVLNAAGYYFKRSGNQFSHPTAIFMITPEGKIIRYIYGSNFLPFDITMAATEAEEGKIGWSVKRVLSICFSYDPVGKKYVFNIMKIAGAVLIFFVLTLFIVLVLLGKKRPRG